jgi:hypothetical protein
MENLIKNTIKIDINLTFLTSDNLYYSIKKINFIQDKKLKLILSKLFSQKLFNIFFAKKISSKIISTYSDFKKWLDFSRRLSPKRSSVALIISNGKYPTSFFHFCYSECLTKGRRACL